MSPTLHPSQPASQPPFSPTPTRRSPLRRRLGAILASMAVAFAGLIAAAPKVTALGPEDPVIAGSLQDEAGCSADWAPDCEKTALTKDKHSGKYTATFDVPAGDHEYKVALGGSWDVNYGKGGAPGGDNITISHPGGPLTFWFDPVTHLVQSSAEGPIVTLPGSFNKALGCGGDWAPDCMATWMQDPDGDGVYTFSTSALPAGNYETKVAHGRSWDENYGQDGAPGGANYSFSTQDGKLVTFSYDSASHRLTIEAADPLAPGAGQQLGHFVDADTIAWPKGFSADPAGSTFELWASPEGGMALENGQVTGGTKIADLSLRDGDLNSEELKDRRHLSGLLALDLTGVERAALEEALTGELMVLQRGADGPQAFSGVQIPGVLDALFAKDAASQPLGAQVSDAGVKVGLWAPTARSVELRVFTPGDPADAAPATTVAMTRGAGGVWSAQGPASWEDHEYVFAVEVFVPAERKVVTNVVTDPYSTGLTLNSTRSLMLDLEDERWAPEVWSSTPAPKVSEFARQTIYELHLRDFSAGDEKLPEALRGSYAAVGHPDSQGTQRLRELAQAGMTTVHLLPTFDIATIQEDRAKQKKPQIPADAGPASKAQQEAVAAVADEDAYNWGYDPLHYMTPEGSYATAENQNTGRRTAEFRSMVGHLHDMGLQVVLDQVYNHTAGHGQGEKSVLDKIVPGYYHRLNLTGGVENSTCCSNIATEHAMGQRIMVDSTVLWARHYHVDGFRFDLMGHHSRENMEAVRAALDELTVERDGVDGKSIYLYGEGWNFGEVQGNARFQQATQGQLDGTSIGAFNDRLRDAVHGGSPFDTDKRTHQGFGNGLFTMPNGSSPVSPEEQLKDLRHRTDLIRVGLAGSLKDFKLLNSEGKTVRADQIDYNGQGAGYTSRPEEAVNYVDAHDNEALYDMNVWKLPLDASTATRTRMNTLSLATATLGQSPSFWAGGTDLMRSKSLDRDSYNSGDHFNAIDWSGTDNGYGRGLPPKGKNGEAWDLMVPLLEDADGTKHPTAKDIAFSREVTLDLLRLRHSTALFTLGDAEAIRQKVSFPNAGPEATPGLLVMRVDDTQGTDVDPELDGIVVVFNASGKPITEAIDTMAGTQLELSPVQRDGADPVVKQATWDAGTVTVPAMTVAVFVQKQGEKPAPTPEPTPDPTPAPTPDPTPAPTPAPTPSPAPSPAPSAAPGDGSGSDGQDGGPLARTGVNAGIAFTAAAVILAAGAAVTLLRRRRS